MAIFINLRRIMAQKGSTGVSVARQAHLSQNALSRISRGNVGAIRVSTVDRLCEQLECQPGDLLVYVPDDLAEDYSKNNPLSIRANQ